MEVSLYMSVFELHNLPKITFIIFVQNFPYFNMTEVVGQMLIQQHIPLWVHKHSQNTSSYTENGNLKFE